MSNTFSTTLGISLTLPDGSAVIEESSAGPLSLQFSLANGDVISVVRDDQGVNDLASTIAWTEAMAEYYVKEFGAVEELSGSLESEGKTSFAYSVAYSDAQEVARRATLIGVLLDGGAFVGITLITINDGKPLDVELVQEIVNGVSVNA